MSQYLEDIELAKRIAKAFEKRVWQEGDVVVARLDHIERVKSTRNPPHFDGELWLSFYDRTYDGSEEYRHASAAARICTLLPTLEDILEALKVQGYTIGCFTYDHKQRQYSYEAINLQALDSASGVGKSQTEAAAQCFERVLEGKQQ